MTPPTSPASHQRLADRSRPTSALISPRDMGGFNRAAVVRALVELGPLSRSELARLAGVTRASIGSIVQGLIAAGVLEEQELTRARQVGKPGRPLWFAPGAGAVAAVEIRSSEVRAAVVDARGSLTDEHVVALSDATSAAEVTRTTSAAVTTLVSGRSVIGVGIAVPGMTDAATGEVLGSAQVPAVVGSHLAERVADATGKPTYVENDSRAQAVAEQWFGLGRTLSTYASLQTGDGLGAGLVLDGSIYRGPGGLAGEVGHHTVQTDGDTCVCGQRGCWETIATLRWLRRAAQDAGIRGAAHVDCAQLAARAASDERAAGVLETYATNLATGIANLRQILATEDFILHGDVVGGGEGFRLALEQATLAQSHGAVRLRFTELGDRATLLGAVGVVLSEHLHRVD